MIPTFNIHTQQYWRDKDGHMWRRNGATKTWKTRPDEFRIPVKHGLYAYDYITHLNCDEVTPVDGY